MYDFCLNVKSLVVKLYCNNLEASLETMSPLVERHDQFLIFFCSGCFLVTFKNLESSRRQGKT